MDDKEIVALYWRRDEEALSLTKAKYEPYLYMIAYNILHLPEDAYRSGCGSGRLRILTPALPDVPPNGFHAVHVRCLQVCIHSYDTICPYQRTYFISMAMYHKRHTVSVHTLSRAESMLCIDITCVYDSISFRPFRIL